MKVCANCGESLADERFNFRNKARALRWGTCKSCQSDQRKRWYRKNKVVHKSNTRRNKKRAIEIGQQFIWNYLANHPCVDCGETDPVVLEFDHVTGRKRKAVGDLARQRYSIEAISKEIAKCVVRCANCHRRKTHSERGWFRGR